MKAIFDVGTNMRDGVRLSSNLYLPDEGKQLPTILMRTCYNKTNYRFHDLAEIFCAHGYAFMVNDVRGRGDSNGEWLPWESEFLDGYDVIEWIALQPWCNGKVGTLGGSYLAWVQWAAASTRPPHLTAMITSGSPGHWFHDWPYRDGALAAADYLEWLNRTSGRTLQLPFLQDLAWIKDYHDLRTIDVALGREMPHWQVCLDHTTYDEYWQKLALHTYDEMDFPVLHITGYYDACAAGQLHHFKQMTAKSPAKGNQHLLIGPWNHSNAIHSGIAEDNPLLGLREDASVDLTSFWLAWFERWIKDMPNEVDDWSLVRYYAMGSGQWREAETWPPEVNRELEMYLLGDGSLSSDPPESHAVLTYRYNPDEPICAMPDLSSRLISLEWYPYRVDPLTSREDVITFGSEPLAETLEISGPVEVQLNIKTDVQDTDFVAILADRHPGGQAVMISHGILRASFRESVREPQTIPPGETTLYQIQLSDTAHIFRPGHSIQILITSSLFPWFHPNPNSGEPYGKETKRFAALHQLIISPDTPSKMRLSAR